MSRYRYKISMSYLDIANSSETIIRPECIKSFAVDRDYDNMNMPTALMMLTLDKNLVDQIILGAKDNLFNIFIYKFSLDGDQYAEKIIAGQFTYFLKEDINYNKDLDYSEEETSLYDGMERRDQYRDIAIGLMLKQNIDDNKKTVNDIYYNTSMINIVAATTSNINILIEPFTYDKIMEQLVVPPMESISKVLDMLNKLNAFYDTKYRYFLDWDIGYLLSTSGNSVPKTGEKYPAVMIDIRNITASDAFEEGMTEDENGNCYIIPISTVDSKYTVNNSTDKSFNNLKAVLDNSKKQAEKQKQGLIGTINSLTNAAKKINNAVSSIQSKLSNVGNTLNRMKYEIVDDVETALNTTISVNDVTVRIDEVFSDPRIDVDNKNETLKEIMHIGREISDMYNDVANIPNEYERMRDQIFDNVVNAGSFDSYVNGVDPINYSDNISGLNKLYKNVTDGGKANQAEVDRVFTPVSSKYRELSNKIDQLIADIRNLPDTMEATGGSSGGGGEEGGEGGGEGSTTVDVSAAKEVIPALEALKDPVRACADRFDTNTSTLKEMPDMCISTAEKCNKGISEIIATPNLLKEEFKGTTNNLFNVSTVNNAKTSATQSIIDRTVETAKISMTGFRDLGKKQLEDITNFGSGILNDIKNGLDAIEDISNIGSTGVTEIEVGLDVNRDEYTGDKFKLIRVPNDNANLLKQMKYELELSAATLYINKNDLDTSVITPNKEYTVKNYDTHSDKNGRFLLCQKKEIYIREGDSFILNMALMLKKIPENTN